MATENTPGLYWIGGKDWAPISGVICSREGTSGRDDPNGWGRFAFFPDNWPISISQNDSLFGHVLTQNPQGPFGESVHHCLLDGLRVSCTIMPDGTPLLHTIWPTWTGPETQGFGGATGESTYLNNSTEQGK